MEQGWLGVLFCFCGGHLSEGEVEGHFQSTLVWLVCFCEGKEKFSYAYWHFLWEGQESG